jgi:hypothetical protein
LYKSYEYTDEDIVDYLENCRDEFYNEVLRLIKETYGLKFDYNSLLSQEEKYIYTHYLYSFFVLHIENHLVDYYYNEITQNLESYYDTLPEVNTKDMMYTMYLKSLNKNNSKLLKYLSTIMEECEIEYIDEFIINCIKEDTEELENSSINDILVTETYVEMVTCDTEEFNSIVKKILSASNVLSLVRGKLFNYLLKKEGK